MNLYETLGVDEKADMDTIKRTYRAKAKDVHPDASGDPEEFRELATAYYVLSDPIKRHQYDTTGRTDEPQDKSVGMAVEIFFEAMESDPVRPMGKIEAIIKERLRAVKAQKKSIEADITKREKMLKRIKKRPNVDFLTYAINDQIKQMGGGVEFAVNMISTVTRAGELLHGYGFAEGAESEYPLGPGASLADAIHQAKRAGRSGATFTFNMGGG